MCTRVVYSGTNGMVATGRTMDWKTDMHSNLWVFPRGIERNGETGKDSLKVEIQIRQHHHLRFRDSQYGRNERERFGS